ncbi:MAG: flagellar basal-body rod protein FlgF [Thiohalomonadales bacterium]
MDRVIYIAMSGANQTLLAQQMNSNNLANANTSGFRTDLHSFRAMPVYGPGYPTRAYAMAERPSVDLTLGTVRNTDRDLDIAIDGNGWMAIQSKDGTEAYTRAGNLSIQPGGILVTGSGSPVMGNGGPIALPPADNIVIGTDGTISITPVGQPSTSLVVVDRIKLVRPEQGSIIKGLDGMMRAKNGEEFDANASVKVVSGSLETSNVNIVNTLVNMISLARTYELQIKMMKTSEETDKASDGLLGLS